MKGIKLSVLFSIVCFMGNAQMSQVKSGVYRWDELPVKEGKQRVGRKIMEGTAPYFSFLEMHATTQEKGAKPAAPHTQSEIEEVLFVKEGLMKMTMDGESRILPAGSVILIPPLVEQSLENVGDGSLTYYVMMFKAEKEMDIERSNTAGGALFIDSGKLEFKPTTKGGRVDYMRRPTAMCEEFEMHVTLLNEKGPSHQAHSHKDAEMILMIEGEAEMTIDGQKYDGKVGDLFLMNPNQMHTIANRSNIPCRYYAFRWF